MDRSAFMKAADAMAGGDRARDARGPVQHALTSAQNKRVANPNDLVARALAILAEGNMMSGETQSAKAVNTASEFGTQSAKGGNTKSEFGTQSTDLTLQQRLLNDGTECPLPIRYFDVQCLVATFLADPGRATELLKGTGLQLVPQQDGMAIVELYCIEYRKTDIGPYNEVGLAILALAPSDPVPAIYVVNLPVTTAVANRAGRELWGYNKFVAAIDIKRDGKKFSTELRDLENAPICTLEGRFGASVPVPPDGLLTFTLLNGRVIKTLIQVLTTFHVGSGDGFVFKVGTSKHPMTNNLRTLALDGARPVLVKYADPFQALLFPGRAV